MEGCADKHLGKLKDNFICCIKVFRGFRKGFNPVVDVGCNQVGKIFCNSDAGLLIEVADSGEVKFQPLVFYRGSNAEDEL